PESKPDIALLPPVPPGDRSVTASNCGRSGEAGGEAKQHVVVEPMPPGEPLEGNVRPHLTEPGELPPDLLRRVRVALARHEREARAPEQPGGGRDLFRQAGPPQDDVIDASRRARGPACDGL